MKQIGSILDEQNWLETMELACKRSIDANPEREGDFMKDGFLHCGKCKEPKREYFEWHGHQILTSRDCKCIRDEKERIEKQKQYEEKMARIARLRSVSLMDEVFYKATFKNFDITDDNRKIYNACAKYCRAFQQMLEDNQGLLFYGNVSEIVKELLDEGIIKYYDRNFVAPRLTELKEAGKVKVVGKRKCIMSGKMIAVWERVDQ